MTDFIKRKSPGGVLDYTFDWNTNWLDGDTISTSSWSADSGITIDSDTNTTTTATVWLSGGTADTEYEVTNTIVTAGGRTAQRTLIVKVEKRYN